jgi:hypothetical protein
MYPVEVAYLREPSPNYVQKAAEVIWNINLQVIICFMPTILVSDANWGSSKVLEMS